MSIGFVQKGRAAWRAPRALSGILLALTLVAAACGGNDDEASTGNESEESAGASSTGADEEPSGTLRLGYFPNVTHAPAIIGVDQGIFAEKLGEAKLETSIYPTGTEASEALLSGSIDATFIGPNPAINGYATSLAEDGGALRIVAGTTSGGASLVVKPEINSSADLKGTTLATPSLGNTQDVALRAWLGEEGLETDTSGGGDVSILNKENADTLTAFQQGDIDGAWVPEPWGTRLVLEGGGKVLVNESDLWADTDGQFVTTHLIVRTDYLEEHPANVRALVDGLIEAIEVANGDAATAQATVNDGIEALTQKRLEDETIQGAWANLTFTWDPVAASLETSKDDAVGVELLEDVDLGGIYDLAILNDLLAERGEGEVAAL